MNTRALLAIAVTLSWPLALNAQNIDAAAIASELGIRESNIPSREMPGWDKPDNITILTFRALPPTGIGSKEWMLEPMGNVQVTFFAADSDADYSQLADTDVIVGWCSRDAIEAAPNLRYLHLYLAGIDRCASIPGIADRGLIATNSAKAASETIAEHAIALMLMLTRGLHSHHVQQMKAQWRGVEDPPPVMSVKGKTMLVLGLGGIGSQVAKRANGLGMTVIGTRNSSRSGPDYVSHVGLASETSELAGKADVVVNALPLTDSTRGIVDAAFFDAMPEGSYYVTVGRGGTTNTDALLAALKSGKLAGAGLDVFDTEPLPGDHPLWGAPNVVISPHTAASSDLSTRNTMILARENLRRYINGEKLLNMVDLSRGY